MSNDTKALRERLRRMETTLALPNIAADTIERLERELAEADRLLNECRIALEHVESIGMRVNPPLLDNIRAYLGRKP